MLFRSARGLGASDLRVILRHIMPNLSSFLIVTATLALPGYILGESGLSFLGLGIKEPMASWGLLLNDARTDVYVKGQMSAPQVCTAANVGGGPIVSVTIDPLAQQWVQVRRSAQLSTCSAVRSDSACSAF